MPWHDEVSCSLNFSIMIRDLKLISLVSWSDMGSRLDASAPHSAVAIRTLGLRKALRASGSWSPRRHSVWPRAIFLALLNSSNDPTASLLLTTCPTIANKRQIFIRGWSAKPSSRGCLNVWLNWFLSMGISLNLFSTYECDLKLFDPCLEQIPQVDSRDVARHFLMGLRNIVKFHKKLQIQK
ncbi:hypothetical protein BpHYR1_032452 [Brachionus plicatilis]|uniref:Uncharacterized protein n=1 Tax=Brachionus plicatilis TaxID=10195 RepID=A0A3M7SUG5_BRAPC|nr:hypothetical protein BpHYR1_032452 [Brachionus plicatilis]